MSRTLEEVAAGAIDGLYQEALFLSGGSEEAAEELLIRTFAHSFRAFRENGTDEDPARWLEGRLVKEFLESVGKDEALRAGRDGPETKPGVTGDPPDPAGLDPTALHRAAGRLPAGARAVLWLVLFGRWSYGEVEDFLDIDRSVLRTLLRYRHALLAEVLGAGWGRAPRGRTTTN